MNRCQHQAVPKNSLLPYSQENQQQLNFSNHNCSGQVPSRSPRSAPPFLMAWKSWHTRPGSPAPNPVLRARALYSAQPSHPRPPESRRLLAAGTSRRLGGLRVARKAHPSQRKGRNREAGRDRSGGWAGRASPVREAGAWGPGPHALLPGRPSLGGSPLTILLQAALDAVHSSSASPGAGHDCTQRSPWGTRQAVPCPGAPEPQRRQADQMRTRNSP